MSNTFREKKTVEDGLLDEKEQQQRQQQEQQELHQTEQAEAAQQQPDGEASEPRKSRVNLSHILGGDMLNRAWLSRQTGLIVLVVVFMLFLVANRYHVEKLSRDKIVTEEHIKFLREQRIQMQKDYQESVKISRIARVLDTVGVGLIAGPPYEITVDD